MTPHYEELRDQLHARGLPPGSVRFIHEAKNDADKTRLFAQCRTGDVAVLIGSTAKMGVGTNVQTRAVHLIDMDAPWRPADIEQRHGQILRKKREVHRPSYVRQPHRPRDRRYRGRQD